ncbi:STAS domain-containing protein [Actinomadura craniellae]|nr:STAS domain-containing protein [Actinomadura craniellae]
MAGLARCGAVAEPVEEAAFGVTPTARYGTTVVVEVSGEIDLRTAELLRRELLELSEAGFSRLILDFGQVRFCDATGLGALVGVHNRIVARDGEIVLCGVRPTQRRLLRITGLDRLFAVYGQGEEATGQGRAATPTARG